MPQQTAISAENNFSQGLKTEFTGLNFPENACTSTSNCIFERIGNVTRRLGIDYETNKTLTTIDRTLKAISTYKWNNVGGDGLTQVVVAQIGSTLRFYVSSSATAASPLSSRVLASTVDISSFVAVGGTYDATVECQYADGNGYLFVTHPSCDPFYVVYTPGSPATVAGTKITVNIRDFTGIVENVDDNFRPNGLTSEHKYNIQNQGWTSAPGWTANSTTTITCTVASHLWTIQTGLTISNGQTVIIKGYQGTLLRCNATGAVTSYNSGTGALTLNVTSSDNIATSLSIWTFAVLTIGHINTWNSALFNYPSNADVWWRFKNSSDTFDPATTISNVTLNAGPAPKGAYIMSAFNQDRSTISSVTGLTAVTTLVRPRTCSWFQGRVWYTGVDAAFAATGDAVQSSWTESIYFSQTIQNINQFGKCHQTNDPTSQDLFDLLPTDGGVIQIQGCGSIYKLFPIQNGLLVFAANGIWFITGSQGIGFSANDYTITKLSSIQSISSTSFVEVQGMPMWWNEEGIYTIQLGGGGDQGPSRGAANYGGFQVTPITFASIQTFYQAIPLTSKKYVRGTYDPLNWVVHWTYRSAEETSVTTRYQFDSILVLNTATQAFYPWSLSTTSGVPFINGINYVQSPGGTGAPNPAIKYLCSKSGSGTFQFTFAEELSTSYVDWHTSGVDYDFTSYFITGYKMKEGQAQHKFQSNYIYMYLNNATNVSYKMQGIWDYAISGNSGKFTSLERTVITDSTSNFSTVHRRHRIRGRGLALQFKVTSVTGSPFDILGWSIDMKVNQGV